MKQYYIIILMMASVFGFKNIDAQPTMFGSQLVEGDYTQYILTDLGVFRQLRLQALSSAGASTRNWEFYVGNYETNWRPYTASQTLSGYNIIIDPSSESASARYNSGFGGQSGLLPAVTAGNYYTINVTELSPPNNQFMAILETNFDPHIISAVSVPEIAQADVPQIIDVTVDGGPSPGENVYIRYSIDGYNTSNLVEVTFDPPARIEGKLLASGTATIPGFPVGTNVNYYALSSTLNATNLAVNPDMGTLNLNNNGGSNYNYTTQGVVPVILSNLSSRQIKRHIEVSWSASVEVNNDYYTVERYQEGDWNEIGNVNAQFGRADDNYNYQFIDENPLPGFNVYRLSQTDFDGSHQILGDTKAYFAGIDIQIFPNPAADIVYIAGHNLPDDANLILKDIVGRDLATIRNNRRLNSMDISKFPMGVYQLVVADRDQNILTVQRVIKQ